MFSCEFCEIFKNTIFTEHIRTTASQSTHKTGMTFWELHENLMNVLGSPVSTEWRIWCGYRYYRQGHTLNVELF